MSVGAWWEESAPAAGEVRPGARRARGLRRPFLERFFARVVVSLDPGACWTWAGGRHTLRSGRRPVIRDQHGHPTNAARAILNYLTGGNLSPDLVACHSCGNGQCVRPSHLYAGTPEENAEDYKRHTGGAS